jgi:hypothetical protein
VIGDVVRETDAANVSSDCSGSADMKFVWVNDRVPRKSSICAHCGVSLGTGCLRDIARNCPIVVMSATLGPMISLQYRHFPTSPTLWAFRRSASPVTWCIPRWKRNAGEIYQREQEQRSAQPLLNRERLGMAFASPALGAYVVCDNWLSMKTRKQRLRRSYARSARSLLDDGLEQVLPSALARRFLHTRRL